MKTSEVARLSAEDRLFYWIIERHRIYIKKRAKQPKPWTDDEVLQNYFFTNPYREHDKTTAWFRESIRKPLTLGVNPNMDVVFATICFRWFNLINTGRILMNKGPGRFGYLTKWNWEGVVKVLGRLRDNGVPVFTGAYIINSPIGYAKLEGICNRIEGVWQDRKVLNEIAAAATTMRELWETLLLYEGIGKFMAYEIVCDLRYTHVLRNATDVNTWCNPGPGCRRGLWRLYGKSPPLNNSGRQRVSIAAPDGWRERMQELLERARTDPMTSAMPYFELREIEHSLCEWDKYERVRLNEGRSKRTYQGV